MADNHLRFAILQTAFVDYIYERQSKQMNKLLTAPKEELPVIQGIVKELESMIKEIDRYIRDGEDALDQLTKLLADNEKSPAKEMR